MTSKVEKEYNYWLINVDVLTAEKLKALNADEIYDSFYRDLEFGTGGLRGILGVGTNRMNIYTVRRATQGLANELLSHGKSVADKGVVIAHDSRNMSREFAIECAGILTANGIKAYLFDSLRPTPELSFAVRYLKAARGIVITASHNPKEYNGYKVYGEDGGQIPPSIADGILSYINKLDIFTDVRSPKYDYIKIGQEIDDEYIKAVKEQSMNVEIPDYFKLVYTPIHGSGNMPVRRILDEIGVKNILIVSDQEKPDGDFPTVESPNPENKEALDMAIALAKENDVGLVLGTDPDSDRIGIAVKNSEGEYICLNGNQTGALLCEFILRKLKEAEAMPKNGAIVKTIVTSELVTQIANSYDVATINVLTGFKFIGEKIKEFEHSNEYSYIFGLEESYGYLKGSYARDKDAVVAAMLICQMAADYETKGMTLYDALNMLYERYGYSKERLINKILYGESGNQKINRIMKKLRDNPPKYIGESKVLEFLDYIKGIDGLPKSNVLKFMLSNGWLAVRPSGTEPKIKFYYGLSASNEKKINKEAAQLDDFILSILE